MGEYLGMDNFRFDITSRGPLDDAMRIAFRVNQRAYRFRVDYDWPDRGDVRQRLVLAWTDADGFNPLPAPLNAEQAAQTVAAWLSTLCPDDYPHQPDHDGDNVKGWRVYNEAWGHVGDPYGFVAIEPAWGWLGK